MVRKNIKERYKTFSFLIFFSFTTMGVLALFITNFGIITKIKIPAFIALLCLSSFARPGRVVYELYISTKSFIKKIVIWFLKFKEKPKEKAEGGFPKKNGTLVISLDVDTYWGMIDKISLDEYKNNLLGERKLIPDLLKLFNYYKIHVTWAVVGFLFFENKNDLVNSLPKKKPNYENIKVSPYPYIDSIGPNEKEDPFHYALTLIKLIASYPNQEIGSHTFSHYYCLERGQNEKSFKADLEAAIKISKKNNFTTESLIFPRNQINNKYLPVFRELGIRIFRGNERSFIYKPFPEDERSFLRRIIRFLDCYINISGHNCYSLEEIGRGFPFNVPSSRFLRPSPGGFRILDFLQMRRIFSDLEYAAKNGLVFHLWWHPHNFGLNPEKNIIILKKIFDYYSRLKDKYGMESLGMKELADKIVRENVRDSNVNKGQ